MIQPENVRPLTDFQRNSKACIQKLRRTKRAQLLTVNGRAAAVLVDPEAYQRLIELAGESEEVLGVRKALADAEAGKGIPLANVIAQVRARARALAEPRRRKSA